MYGAVTQFPEVKPQKPKLGGSKRRERGLWASKRDGGGGPRRCEAVSGCFLGSREAGDRGGARIAPCDVALEISSEGGHRKRLEVPGTMVGGAVGVLWVLAAFLQREFGRKSGGNRGGGGKTVGGALTAP